MEKSMEATKSMVGRRDAWKITSRDGHEDCLMASSKSYKIGPRSATLSCQPKRALTSSCNKSS